jgi:hypothetical protein
MRYLFVKPYKNEGVYVFMKFNSYPAQYLRSPKILGQAITWSERGEWERGARELMRGLARSMETYPQNELYILVSHSISKSSKPRKEDKSNQSKYKENENEMKYFK